jgi:methyl-accepting chemotaxis protein
LTIKDRAHLRSDGKVECATRAAEVKSLANQSRVATGQIEAIIQDIERSSADAAGTMTDVTTAIERVNIYTSTISSAITEQTAAVQEISMRAAEVAGKSSATAEAATNVKNTSSSAANAVQDSLATAEQLGRQTNSLQAAAKRFLEHIRAA